MTGLKLNEAYDKIGERFTFDIKEGMQFMFTNKAVSGKMYYEKYYATLYSNVGGNGKELFNLFVDIVSKNFILAVDSNNLEVTVKEGLNNVTIAH